MDRHCCRRAVCVIKTKRSTDEFTYNTYKQTNPCQQESSTFLDVCSNPRWKSFVSFFTNWPFFKFLLLPLSESRLPAAAHMFPPLLLTIVSFTAFVAADCDKWKQSIQLWQKPRFKIIKKKKECASPACWWMWPAASWYMLFIFSQESSEP